MRTVLEQAKSANTQLKSVKGGMSSTDIEAQFRSTSENRPDHRCKRSSRARSSVDRVACYRLHGSRQQLNAAWGAIMLMPTRACLM